MIDLLDSRIADFDVRLICSGDNDECFGLVSTNAKIKWVEGKRKVFADESGNVE